jgi:hypothetical protein
VPPPPPVPPCAKRRRAAVKRSPASRSSRRRPWRLWWRAEAMSLAAAVARGGVSLAVSSWRRRDAGPGGVRQPACGGACRRLRQRAEAAGCGARMSAMAAHGRQLIGLLRRSLVTPVHLRGGPAWAPTAVLLVGVGWPEGRRRLGGPEGRRRRRLSSWAEVGGNDE